MSIFNRSALIGGSAPTGYQIERSARLRSSASAYFNRTPASAGNRQKFTISAWVKRGKLATSGPIMGAGVSGATEDRFMFAGNDTFLFDGYSSGSTVFYMNTTAVFRDPSAWYHFVCEVDTTQATSSNRIKLYVNGVQVTAFATATYPSQNANLNFNNNVAQYIGYTPDPYYADQYFTDVNFIDGQALTPSSFGETDAVTGVWKPKKYAGTYGTNGFFLNFSDPASTTTIGYDYSGNGNNWTSNNISVTAGVTYDSMIDTPTPYDDGGNGRGNYAVLNPLDIGPTSALAAGNLNFTTSSTTNYSICRGTIGASTGKWYWEIEVNSSASANMIGVANSDASLSQYVGQNANGWGYYSSGLKYNNNSGVAYGASFTTGDILGVALDMDAGTITFYKNNTSQGQAYSGITGTIFPVVSDGSSISTASLIANFGQRPFAYTPPTGFKALQTGNLPEPTIVDGGEYFNAVTYTGNGTADRAIDTGFATDLFWVKQRSGTNVHYLTDIVRGPLKGLSSNLTDAESTFDSVRSFTSTGVTVGTSATTNSTGQSFVAWNWKANGAGVSNTDGSITSTVSAGVTQGFSVVTWTGTSTNASTIGHGLGVAPKMIITKSRSNPTSWVVGIGGISGFGVNDYLTINTTSAKGSTSTFYQAYGSSTFTVGVSAADEMNKTGNNYVSYCFAEVPGFSKFGSYTGNGSTDGPFVFTGFRPAYVMIKRTDNVGDWWIYDTSRSTYNAAIQFLYADTSAAEVSDVTEPIDFLSNGFKLRVATYQPNTSGGTFIYMAFAENPFKNALAR